MRLLTVVGNRPQFIKSAPLSDALRREGIDETVVHTGQHWDPSLSAVFFEELELAEPAVALDLRTSDVEAIESAIRAVVEHHAPDAVLVYGDTNSTLAGARAARGLPVAHVEAGLRSGDLEMPEERNRIEVDALAASLFTPDERSAATLRDEGVTGEIHVVGDVMADAAARFGPLARERSTILDRLGLEPGGYVLATVHRETNVRPERLRRILAGLVAFRPARRPPRPSADAGRRRAGVDSGRPGNAAARAARLPRLRRARLAGRRDRDRLGRAAEGGVLVRRPVRHDAAVDGVGRHRRGRCEHARRRRPGSNRRGTRGSPHARATDRRSTATATLPGGSPRCSAVGCRPVHRDVAIVGAGYVGVPLAQVFAEAGRSVLLVDVDAERVAQLNRGESYIEDVPSEKLKELVEQRGLRATTDYDELREADAILIALPTPLSPQREPDLSIVRAATEQIAARLRRGHLVVLESTTYPGTTRDELLPILERGSGLSRRRRLPPRLLARARRPGPGRPHDEDRAEGRRRDRRGVDGGGGRAVRRAIDTVHKVSTPEAAELTKLLENIFRSVNIALVNELAQLCDRMGIDIWEVVDAAATKPFGFMRFEPGPGLGGHCIPIDPFYLTWKAREFDFSTRFIELAGEVNQNMPYYCRSRVSQALNHGARQVALRLAHPRARRRLQGRHLGHARVAGREADPAPAERRGGRLLPRPARPLLLGARRRALLAAARARPRTTPS